MKISMLYNLKPFIATMLVTSGTILFVNTILGTLILLATLFYWIVKNIREMKAMKEETKKPKA